MFKQKIRSDNNVKFGFRTHFFLSKDIKFRRDNNKNSLTIFIISLSFIEITAKWAFK